MSHFRHPKTTNEKRANAAFKVDKELYDFRVKTRLRNRNTRSRLADLYDDMVPAARYDRSRGKPTHSLARKAKQREEGRLWAA
ncbi:MAG: hypothetical protein AB1781_07430 [Pseudomonadota bacterium]